jgi:hypothetical protein
VRADGITSFSMIQMASDAGNAAGARVLSVRSALSRWPGSHGTAADRAQGTAGRLADLERITAALQRSPDRKGPGLLRASLPGGCRRDHLETRRCAVCARQSRALHVIQHTDRNLSSSHTRGTRFTANAFASTVASDVPAVRSCTSRCSQVFPEKFQHGCAMLRCAQRYRRGRPGLQSRP